MVLSYGSFIRFVLFYYSYLCVQFKLVILSVVKYYQNNVKFLVIWHFTRAHFILNEAIYNLCFLSLSLPSDPYVKVSLIQGGKRVKKKKTSVTRNTVSPVFNEALTFSVSKEQLKASTIEFCVMNDSILGQNEMLGRSLIGPDCKGEELEYFQEVLTSKTAVAQWLVLGDPE